MLYALFYETNNSINLVLSSSQMEDYNSLKSIELQCDEVLMSFNIKDPKNFIGMVKMGIVYCDNFELSKRIDNSIHEFIDTKEFTKIKVM